MDQLSIAIMCGGGMAELQAMKARTEDRDRTSTFSYMHGYLLYSYLACVSIKCDVGVTKWYFITKITNLYLYCSQESILSRN